MRTLILFLLTICITHTGNAQLIKKIGDRIKENAEWKAQQKMNQKIEEGLDSLTTVPKKIVDKKKAKKKEKVENTDPKKNNSSANKKDNPGAQGNLNASSDEETDMAPKDGFLTLRLSNNKVLTNASVLISGESIRYKNFTGVEITVKGQSDAADVRTVSLNNDGKYFAEWNASIKTGDYTVTVKTGDKKTVQSAIFSVEEPDIIFDESWPEDNTKETKKALDKLEDATEKAEAGLSPKDKAELEKKMAEVKAKADVALKLFKDLNTAAKELTRLTKSGKKLSPNLAVHLTALNNSLADQAAQMKKISALTDHQPLDNTICEHLVMVNEACAAFSAFTNFWSTSLKTILLNITLDKGVPKAVEIIKNKTVNVSSPTDFLLKEPAKIFATSRFDAESLTSKLGKAGIAGDVTQFATDVLMKKYCGVFKGEIKHDYTIDFRNSDGVTWWKYGVVMQGALSLRYPKEGSKGNIIKMKGNFEGNATKFTFYQNIEADDGFNEGTKGKIEVVELKVIKPPAFPFVSSLNDPAGFGAAARTLVTPACFNMVIEAEYDVDAGKIKLFVAKPMIDFSPAIVNQLVFLMIGADLLPYFKRMLFPIHKAYRTLVSVVRDHNEFTVEKDAQGNLSFSGKANKHLGSKSDKIEHNMNYSVTAKKE